MRGGSRSAAAEDAASSYGCLRGCEPDDGEYSCGRYVHISGKREWINEYECDVVGKWNEWRLGCDRNN